jgi:hypothetical protein
MYWWNVSKLAADLREGRVDERQRFNYYLATFIAWNLAAQLFFLHGDATFSIERLITVTVILAFSAIGIILCYRVNKKGDDTDFIARMICLGWPIGIQFAVMLSAFALAGGVAISLGEASLGRSFLSAFSDQIRGLWRPFYWNFFILPYYFTISLNLISIARGKKAEDSPPTPKTDWSLGKVVIGILGGIGIVIVSVSLLIWIQQSHVGNVILGELLIDCIIVVPMGLLLFWPLLRQIYKQG